MNTQAPPYQSGSITRIMNLVIDIIDRIADHFLIEKKVTLSEAAVLALSLGRVIWYALFGVQIGNLQPGTFSTAWTGIFAFVVVLHLASFAISLKARSVAMLLQGFVWGMMAMLVLMHAPDSPTLPTFSTVAAIAAFIAFRLYRESIGKNY